MNFEINKDLTPPIYVYYKLDKFYNNHREFVKSKDYEQLKGKSLLKEGNCGDMKYYKDYFNGKVPVSYTGKELSPSSIMNPCGLISASTFNDTISFLKKEETIFINETKISYKSDRKYMFKHSEKEDQWIDVENEHFIMS